ncbi:MAG: Bcr/CflA family drug resistance efflux transporter [Alphaproteobacteria bacterium]|nr:MAG: Bcr/CflA family drug resistance efflux transporter [Alphaproteobacteria bacterium]
MPPGRFLDRSTQPHIITLVFAAALGPVAMNVFLPALPAIARDFNTDYAVAQLAVPLFLAATAFFQIIVGSLSDQYGRRPVLLTSILIGLVATIAAIHAPTIEVFLAARVFQGVAIAGVAISRATIRDTVGTDEAASRIGYVTMGMTLAPMIGPIVGGYLAESHGWQATFWLVAAFSLTTLVLVWADLGETNRSLGQRLGAQMRSYPLLLGSRRFWGYAATSAFASGAFFAFVGGGPYLSSEYYGLPSSHYGYYFGFSAIGYVLGNYLSGRHARHRGINSMMVLGGVAASLGIAVALLLHGVGLDHPLAFFGPIFAVGLGNGLTLPSANAGIVSVRPQIAGAASGLGGFLQVGGGAALAALAGVLLGPGSGPAPLILLMLGSSVLSVVSALYVIAVARSVAASEDGRQ